MLSALQFDADGEDDELIAAPEPADFPGKGERFGLQLQVICKADSLNDHLEGHLKDVIREYIEYAGNICSVVKACSYKLEIASPSSDQARAARGLIINFELPAELSGSLPAVKQAIHDAFQKSISGGKAKTYLTSITVIGHE
jgi:hypothetical protein